MKIKNLLNATKKFILNYNQYFLFDIFPEAVEMTSEEIKEMEEAHKPKEEKETKKETSKLSSHKKYDKAISVGVMLGYLIILMSIKKCTTDSFLPAILISKEPPQAKNCLNKRGVNKQNPLMFTLFQKEKSKASD